MTFLRPNDRGQGSGGRQNSTEVESRCRLTYCCAARFQRRDSSLVDWEERGTWSRKPVHWNVFFPPSCRRGRSSKHGDGSLTGRSFAKRRTAGVPRGRGPWHGRFFFKLKKNSLKYFFFCLQMPAAFSPASLNYAPDSRKDGTIFSFLWKGVLLLPSYRLLQTLSNLSTEMYRRLFFSLGNQSKNVSLYPGEKKWAKSWSDH